jgi:hypothetical protein
MISDFDLLQVYQDGYNYDHTSAVRAVYNLGIDAGMAQALPVALALAQADAEAAAAPPVQKKK